MIQNKNEKIKNITRKIDVIYSSTVQIKQGKPPSIKLDLD